MTILSTWQRIGTEWLKLCRRNCSNRICFWTSTLSYVHSKYKIQDILQTSNILIEIIKNLQLRLHWYNSLQTPTQCNSQVSIGHFRDLLHDILSMGSSNHTNHMINPEKRNHIYSNNHRSNARQKSYKFMVVTALFSFQYQNRILFLIKFEFWCISIRPVLLENTLLYWKSHPVSGSLPDTRPINHPVSFR